METLNTLNFISKAKKINVHPKMNFQTKNDNAKEKHISRLIEKVQFLEKEKEVLQSENESLKVKLEIEKQRDQLKLQEKDSTIEEMNKKILELQKKLIKMEDLDKTIVVKSKPFNDRKKQKQTLSNQIAFCSNYMRPKLKMEKKKIEYKTWGKTLK